jgi:hypothetical protein
MKFSCPDPGKQTLFALSLLFFNGMATSTMPIVLHNLPRFIVHGQVFLTWKNPGATNLQYNIYRSATKFTATSQLTSDKLLGFVRDNSGKNIQRSEQEGGSIYFKITDNGAPLASTKGLYVVTCTNNQSWYYAVTVTNLATNKE